MKKFIVLFLLFIMFFITCTEMDPIESKAIEIQITGEVYTDDFGTVLNGIELELKGDEVLKDTTDSEGKFLFKLETEGEYSIVIDNDEYIQYDSTLFVTQDSTIIINLLKLKKNEIQISGEVYTDDYRTALSGIDVKLNSDNVLTDTTDNDGKFLFHVEHEGTYSISINEKLYLPVDTTLFIKNDTTVILNLEDSIIVLSEKQKKQLTYLPLSVGNKWIYRNIITIYDSWYEVSSRDTLLTFLLLGDETEGVYSTEQNTFTTARDIINQVAIMKNNETGQLNIGFRIYYLFGKIGEHILIEDGSYYGSSLEILSEKVVSWNGSNIMEKQFKINQAWEWEIIYFLEGIGIRKIIYTQDYYKSEYDLVAWKLDEIAYGDTTLLN